MLLTLPIPGFASIVCLAVFGFSGDGIDRTPGGSSLIVQHALFLFRKLFVGDESFHNRSSYKVVTQSYQTDGRKSTEKK